MCAVVADSEALFDCSDANDHERKTIDRVRQVLEFERRRQSDIVFHVQEITENYKSSERTQSIRT